MFIRSSRRRKMMIYENAKEKGKSVVWKKFVKASVKKSRQEPKVIR